MAKVLLIEDYPSLQKIYKEALEQDGHTVSIADNTADGLKIALSKETDIILLDLLLQQSHGLDFLVGYGPKKHPHTRIIIISNLFTTELLNQAMELGATHYLVKSEVAPAQLVKIVHDTLNGTAQQNAKEDQRLL